jgi:hypothetical protein
MNIGTPFIAEPQPVVLMEPTQRPLHDSAEPPQSAAVLGPLLSQHRLDSGRAKPSASMGSC